MSSCCHDRWNGLPQDGARCALHLLVVSYHVVGHDLSADSSGRRNTLTKEVAMNSRKRRSDRSGRAALSSPENGRAAFYGFGRGCRSLSRAGKAGPVGQRLVRELLRHPRMRATRPPPVRVPSRSQDGLLQLHRGLVQPCPATLRPGLPLANRVRSCNGGNHHYTVQRRPADLRL